MGSHHWAMPSSGSDAVDNCQTQLPSAAERDFFFFFLWLAFLHSRKKARGPERLPPAGAAGPEQGAGYLPACSSCSTAVYAGISSPLGMFA